MPIGTSDGKVYESELDMLLQTKDMPSREETNRQQKMTDFESAMPPDMKEPSLQEMLDQYDLQDASVRQLNYVPPGQNQPYEWGMGQAMDRTAPAMVPQPEATAQKVQATAQNPDHLLEAVNIVKNWVGEKADAYSPLISQLANLVEREAPAPGADKEKVQKEPNAFSKPTKEDQTEAYIKNLKPSGLGESYDAFNAGLIRLADKMQPDFIPTPEQFKNASWREQLGWMVGTTMMMAAPTRGKSVTGEVLPSRNALDFWKEGLAEYDKIDHPVINTLKTAEKAGSEQAGKLLDVYKKIDDPMVKMEFGRMVSNRLSQASRMAEENVPGGAKFENPKIFKEGDPGGPGRPPKEGGPWTETTVDKDGNKTVSYNQAKIERLRNLLDNGNTYQEIADKLDTSRGSVASMVKRIKDGEFDVTKKASDRPDLITQEDQSTTKNMRASSDALLERLKAEGQAKPFSPKGAVNAPEKGSGSGGGDWSDRFLFDRKSLPKRETDIEGKSGISTPNTIPEKAANRNDNLQIDDPVMEAAIDKTWENFGRANRDNLPLISPAIEGKLQEMNPAAFKKLKNFELEMDYKYKQPQGRRHWLSDLTKDEADRYRTLYNNIDKVRPVK